MTGLALSGGAGSLLPLHGAEDGASELVSGRVSAHVAGPGLALGNDIVDGL